MQKEEDDNQKPSTRLLLKNAILSRHPNFTLAFPVGNSKEIKVPIGKISYIESDGVLSKFHMQEGERKTISIAATIGECEKKLAAYAFIRTHRSYMVNASCLAAKEWDREGTMTLSCGMKLPISRRRKSDIQEILEKIGLTHLL